MLSRSSAVHLACHAILITLLLARWPMAETARHERERKDVGDVDSAASVRKTNYYLSSGPWFGAIRRLAGCIEQNPEMVT